MKFIQNIVLISSLFCSLIAFSANSLQSLNIQNDENLDGEKKIVYEVTEIIHMNFGTSITHYKVDDKKLIKNNNLGPNNTRTIKEIVVYKKGSKKKNAFPISEVTNNDLKSNVIVDQNKVKKITVNPLETYERLVKKGIKSKDIYIKLGDHNYYNNEYKKASSYYDSLFKLTTKIESEYYIKQYYCLKQLNDTNRTKHFFNKHKNILRNIK